MDQSLECASLRRRRSVISPDRQQSYCKMGGGQSHYQANAELRPFLWHGFVNGGWRMVPCLGFYQGTFVGRRFPLKNQIGIRLVSVIYFNEASTSMPLLRGLSQNDYHWVFFGEENPNSTVIVIFQVAARGIMQRGSSKCAWRYLSSGDRFVEDQWALE
jgi:hypothetical protein